MSERTVTISEVLDLAVQRLPRLRRGVMKMRLQSPRYREHLLAELRLHASEDSECCLLMGQPFADSLADASIGDATPFAIDLGKLDQMIELFLKWLPKILDLLKLFAIAAFLVFLLSVPGTATAQCANGQCVLRAAARVVAAPVNVVRSVAPRYASVSAVSGYGSAGSSVASYGSAGSQAAQAAPRWRLGDRIRANRASRAAANYGSAGSAASYSSTSYGSAGSMMIMPVAASPCGCPDCTCVDCKCQQASAPAVPVPMPTDQTYIPQFALPPDRPIELFASYSYPK